RRAYDRGRGCGAVHVLRHGRDRLLVPGSRLEARAPPAGGRGGRALQPAAQAGPGGRVIRAPASLGTDVPTGFRPMLKRANLLIGERRRYVFALAFTAAVSGFTEAATLVLVAQVGVSLVRHENTARAHLGPFHPHARLLTLIYVMFGLTIIRLALQFPISHLPARIAADVQASARKRIFHAYTRASWHVQSLDREGQLQETMTSQVMQATGAAMQFTTMVSALL